jgi:hypothetical protein
MESPKKYKSNSNKLLRYFATAFIGSLIYLSFHIPIVNIWFQTKIKNQTTILIIQTLILFTGIYITNQIIFRHCFYYQKILS